MESFRLAIELPYHSIKIMSYFLKQKKKILRIKENIISARKFAHREFKKREIPVFGKFGNSVTFKFVAIILYLSLRRTISTSSCLLFSFMRYFNVIR